MLFFWVFSLAAGVANACLLQQRPASHGHATAVSHEAMARDAEPAAGSEACLSFCSDEQGLVPTLKLPALPDVDLDHAVVLDSWQPWSADRPTLHGSPRATLPPPQPAVAILLLRLTR